MRSMIVNEKSIEAMSYATQVNVTSHTHVDATQVNVTSHTHVTSERDESYSCRSLDNKFGCKHFEYTHYLRCM